MPLDPLLTYTDKTVETTTASGVITVGQLNGPIIDHDPFYQVGRRAVGSRFDAEIRHTDPSKHQWQTCKCELTGEAEFTVVTVYTSSNNNEAVDFAAGVKYVINDLTATTINALLLPLTITDIPDLSSLYTTPDAAAGIAQDVFEILFEDLTLGDISGNLDYSRISGAGPFAANFIPTITAAMLGTDAVTQTKILDGAVTTSKINDTAVTAGKLATDSVITAKVADLAITDAKIAAMAANKLSGDVAAARIAAALVGGTLPFSGTTVSGTAATFTGDAVFGPAGSALGDARVVVNPATSGKGILVKLPATAGNAIEVQINGSVTPAFAVTALGDLYFKNSAAFQQLDSGGTARTLFQFDTGNIFNITNPVGNVIIRPGSGRVLRIQNSAATTNTFQVNDTGAVTNTLVLDAGKVGILTNTPSAALDVNSDTIRVRTSGSPASGSAGNEGDIRTDSSYIYVYRSGWKRSALAAY